jgi:hypothetical protein
MCIAYHFRRRTLFVAGALLLSSLALGGCATSTGSSLMDARAEAPMPSSKPSAYLAVEDLPRPREKAAMTADERTKLQQELIAARARQEAAAKAQGGGITDPIKP